MHCFKMYWSSLAIIFVSFISSESIMVDPIFSGSLVVILLSYLEIHYFFWPSSFISPPSKSPPEFTNPVHHNISYTVDKIFLIPFQPSCCSKWLGQLVDDLIFDGWASILVLQLLHYVYHASSWGGISSDYLKL